MLTIDLGRESNPLIVSDEISFAVSDGLRDRSMSLYSAFLLNQDVLRLRRIAYRQPAWHYQLSLSGVLALYMQYLFALAIDEASVANTVGNWVAEDFPLLGEKREHYIANYLAQLPAVEPSQEQLLGLSRIRGEYESLPDSDGPYHTEVFPYDYYSPEDALLGRSDTSIDRGGIEPEVAEIMLKISEWG